MVQFGGFGVSVGRQYYHAKKRSDETPLEYLFRLNLAAIRAKISFREGPSATRREHVEYFIETLDDRDLAKQLALLRLEDAYMMEDTLRAYQRKEHRQTKVLVGSNKFRQRSDSTADRISSKPARAVRPIRPIDSVSKDSETSGPNRMTNNVVFAWPRRPIEGETPKKIAIGKIPPITWRIAGMDRIMLISPRPVVIVDRPSMTIVDVGSD